MLQAFLGLIISYMQHYATEFSLLLLLLDAMYLSLFVLVMSGRYNH